MIRKTHRQGRETRDRGSQVASKSWKKPRKRVFPRLLRMDQSVLDTQQGLCQTFLNEEDSVIVEQQNLC